MAKISIKIDEKTGLCYIPQSIRREGFTGAVELLTNALTVILIKPGTKLTEVGRSLELVQQDVALRTQQETIMDQESKKAMKSSKTTAKQEETASGPRHPLFIKYTRAWLHGVTGYSKGYLSRIATGKIPISRLFMAKAAIALGESEELLFLLEGAEKEEKN